MRFLRMTDDEDMAARRRDLVAAVAIGIGMVAVTASAIGLLFAALP